MFRVQMMGSMSGDQWTLIAEVTVPSSELSGTGSAAAQAASIPCTPLVEEDGAVHIVVPGEHLCKYIYLSSYLLCCSKLFHML